MAQVLAAIAGFRIRKQREAKPARRRITSPAAIRETVEVLVTVLILVFLLRTFEVQAFVIPTGSLAPTLLGRHKSVVCPQCGYPYQVSAAGEVNSANGAAFGPDYRVEECTCPMCRYAVDVGPDNPQGKNYPSLGGERVLVSMFAYQIAQPQRWDIAPFKYPGAASTNYIKRIVGLPGETVRISHGDLLIRRNGQRQFRIARKPPHKILAMLHPVYDNDYASPAIIERGWPARWQPWPAAGDSSGDWVASEDGRSFHTDGSSAGEAWLRYQHFVPSPADWRRLQSNTLPTASAPRPQLIDDFCGFNVGRSHRAIALSGLPGLESVGLHWVGDLAVQCTLEVQSRSGEAVFELVEGGRRMQCRIDVATGVGRLSIRGLDGFEPKASTSVRGPGRYRIRFANVDDQLTLWVDGSVVDFDAATTYAPLNNTRPRPADLSPVGIASRGAALRISHLRLWRDVYYIADRRGGAGMLLTDFDPLALPFRLTPDDVARFLSDPGRWRAFEARRSADFALGGDQFLMLGDNSPRSKDSRLWEREGFEYYVARRLLLGKALLVIWPHSPSTIPGTSLPCFPNIRRMRSVQ